MSPHSRAFLLVALTLACSAAVAQEFSFEGTVDSGTGLYAGATGTVTGTYTFDFAAAIPSQSTPSSSIGSAYMVEASEGGYYFGDAEPTAVVFSSTASFSGFSFNNGGPQENKTEAYFMGQYGEFTGVEQTVDANGKTLFSSFQVVPPDGEYAYSTTTGLPILNGSATGQLSSTPYGGSTSSLTFTVTSLTEISPVPEPSFYLLLPVGLAALALWRRRGHSGLSLRAARDAA